MSLLEALEAAGLAVESVPGWQSRGSAWAEGKPLAVMHHHTAAPVPFPVDRLYGTRLKANINTKPDGTVWLIAQGACNYSSGPGSSVVLDEVRAKIDPPANARERGLVDDYNANPFFWNFENDHLGHGEPLPQVQFDAIVTATEVVLAHFGISQVVSHAESTRRKRDPHWNGSLRAIEEIRKALMPSPKDWDAEDWEAFDKHMAELVGPVISIPGEPNRKTTQFMVNAFHAKSNGRKIYQTIDQARDFAKTAAEGTGDHTHTTGPPNQDE